MQGAPAVDLARRHSSAAVRAAAAAAETVALSADDGDDDAQNTSTTVASTFLYSFRRASPLDSSARRPQDAGLDDDLAYAFGAPLVAATHAGRSTTTNQIDPFTGSFTQSDRELSETVMNYWINFIRTGCVVVMYDSSK